MLHPVMWKILLQIEIWMWKKKNEKANLIREAEKRDYQMLKE